MKRGDRLRVIDAEPLRDHPSRPMPPFKVGDVVTVERLLGTLPHATVELREHPPKSWNVIRFEPVEG